ncbi:MAG TPA: hypothetical protein VHZ03_11055 [Trebonia sp.]|jgi:hypothetical protein|nr:hypothetical protein [Trebonia sp.]
MRRRLPAAILAALGCLALATTGCAATQGAGSRATSTGASGTTAADASYASTVVSPRQRAEAAATAILRAFVPPHGASRQAGEPASARHSLDSVGGYVSAYEIRKTSWWLAPGQAAAIIAWETAHVPRTYTRASAASSGGPGKISVTGQFYELRSSSPMLTGQYLIVWVADLGGGKTAIRVDAEVGYRPARPAGEKVPATARAVTITAVFGYSGATAPRPATITSLSVVRTLAALVNGLQLSAAPPDAPCPEAPGLVLKLTFRATAAGRPLAVAQGPGGCDTLALTVAGKEWPLLGSPGAFSTQVLRIARLHWSAMN